MPPAAGEGRAAVFLDRVGTLIVDRHYLADPAGVELIPGAAAALARLNQAGIPVVQVTNQSGIGRGYLDEARYQAVHARLLELLAAEGARVEGEYHCPLAPGEPDPGQMRKPGSGMYRLAAREHGLALARCWYVGDRRRDVQPALELGGQGILVPGPESEPEAAGGLEGVRVAANLGEAVDLILAPAG
jgi:histidinol-phosphate phosphatase family protein